MDAIARNTGRWFLYRCRGKDFCGKFLQPGFAFALALILIYLVLAAQFESFVDPFIIMFTVPLALAGAVLSLNYYLGQTLNIFSQIGIIMLITSNVQERYSDREFANQRKEQGLNAWTPSRMRGGSFLPILMTSLSTIPMHC